MTFTLRPGVTLARAAAMACAAASLVGCAHGGEGLDLRRVTVPGDGEAAPTPRLEVVWRNALVPYEPFVWKPLQFSQPQVSPEGDLLVVGTSRGDVVAVDTFDGQVAWTAHTGARVDAQPVFAGDLVLVGNDDGAMVALGRKDGAERWRHDTRAEIDGGVTVAEGRALFMNSADEVYALDAATGKYLWSYGRQMPDYFTLSNASQPQVRDGVVVAGFADGFMVALQLESGDEIWESDLRNGQTNFTDVDGKPALVGDWVYGASHAGGLFGLDAATGQKRWRVEVTGSSTVLVVGDTLYATTAGRYVMAVDRLTGQILWQFRHRENTPTTPTILAQYLFYGGSDAGLYVVDRLSGYPLVHFDPDVGFNSSMVFHGSHAFAFSNGGTLYGFEVVAD